jgi:hypothetical protein
MSILEFPFVLALAIPALAIIIVLAIMLPRRIRMERRARALLAQYPDAERFSVYLKFRSGWYRGKGREMDARIAEMAADGWTFLRATEASPLRTMRSWGGGLDLQFIRAHPDEPHTTHAA